MGEPKMVKVRVLVVIDSSGDWVAAGGKGCDWGDLIHCADGLNGGVEAQAWLTAEIPIPQPQEIAAVLASRNVVHPEDQ